MYPNLSKAKRNAENRERERVLGVGDIEEERNRESVSTAEIENLHSLSRRQKVGRN